MSLSNDAKKILVVAMANAGKAAEVSTAIDANTVANTASTAHAAADGKSHSDVVLNNTHRGSNGTNHANVVLNDTHRASAGTDHSDVVLNSAARNVGYRIAAIMIATTGDATTDATTLGVLIGDFVVEVSVAGNAVTGSGIAIADNTFVGIVTVSSMLVHYRPIV